MVGVGAVSPLGHQVGLRQCEVLSSPQDCCRPAPTLAMCKRAQTVVVEAALGIAEISTVLARPVFQLWLAEGQQITEKPIK